MLRVVGALLVSAFLTAGTSHAQPAPASDEFPIDAPGPVALSAGLVTGFPPALSTGLGTGIGAAGTLAVGPVRLGARAAWITASESSAAWEVTHSDLQLRALAGIEHVAGRGTIGLRIGAGGSLIHESRRRAQGERAGLQGDELAMSAWNFAPAFDLEMTTSVGIYGAWSAVIAGGPSLVFIDGEATASWVAMLGAGWRP